MRRGHALARGLTAANLVVELVDAVRVFLLQLLGLGGHETHFLARLLNDAQLELFGLLAERRVFVPEVTVQLPLLLHAVLLERAHD